MHSLFHLCIHVFYELHVSVLPFPPFPLPLLTNSYCDCFSHEESCSSDCSCRNCRNNPAFSEMRELTMKVCVHACTLRGISSFQLDYRGPLPIMCDCPCRCTGVKTPQPSTTRRREKPQASVIKVASVERRFVSRSTVSASK